MRPAFGALGAVALGYARTWQLIFGAILGTGVAWLIARKWSGHAATRALQNGEVVAYATGLGWRDHLTTAAILTGIAALIGGLVAVVQRLTVAGSLS